MSDKKQQRTRVRNIAIVLLVVALVANHFTAREYFPFSPDYEFPLGGVLFTLVIGAVLIGMAEWMFSYFNQRFFQKDFSTNHLIYFLSTLLVVTIIIYVGSYLIIIYLGGANYDAYGLTTGMLVSLLVSIPGVAALWGKDIYRLYQKQKQQERLKVTSGKQLVFVEYAQIAYFYSLEKTVYLVKRDGERLVTDFALNQLETDLTGSVFFRVNRQAIVSHESVVRLKPEVNGKKSIQLEPAFNGNDQLSISRYKAKEFEDWLLSKS